MIDKILVDLVARLRLKRYIWPSCEDDNFLDEIEKWQKSKRLDPRRRYLRGLMYEKHNISGYPCYVLSSPNGISTKRVLYIHGGAFVFPISQFHWRLIAYIVKKTGQTVVVPLYPLVPQYTYKEIHAHIKEVYLCILKDVKPTDVTIIGDSAGGTLALILPFLVPRQLQPKRIIAMSPGADLGAVNSEMDRIEPHDPLLPLNTIRYLLPSYYKGLTSDNPLISPLYADYRECASKLVIYNGGRDVLSPDISQLHRRLVEDHVKHDYIFHESLPHAWPLLPLLATRKTRKEVCSLICK